MNLGYTVGSLVQTGLLVLSYRSKKSSILVLPVLVALTVRQGLRLFDIEETKPELLCDGLEEDS